MTGRPDPNYDPSADGEPPNVVHLEPATAPALQFQSLAELADSIRHAPSPRWLVRGLLAEGDYGVVGAEDKAGKTWLMLDLAVGVAGDGFFLDHWPIDSAGPVLLFVGEGSARKILRRLYAIGDHYGLSRAGVDALPIRICCRVPTLTNAQHLAEVMQELDQHQPSLVILDPLYLAIGDAETSNLARMGAVLGAIQYAAQNVGAALLVAHHWNKTGTGTDRKRFTGAGAAEWGRVLASLSVLRRSTEDPGGSRRSVVDLKLEVIGDDTAVVEQTFRREVWSDDPDDLGSPMHYRIESTELDPRERTGPSEYDAAKTAGDSLRHFFTTHPDEKVSTRNLLARLRDIGHQHRDVAVKLAAVDLVATGVLIVEDGPRGSRLYSLAPSPSEDEA